MSKSIKLKDNIYIDSTGIAHNKVPLNEVLGTYVTRAKMSTLFLASVSSINNLKSYFVNDAPVGVSFWHITINGAVKGCLLQKANNNYLSFIYFSYSDNAKQYKYLNGTWSEYAL